MTNPPWLKTACDQWRWFEEHLYGWAMAIDAGKLSWSDRKAPMSVIRLSDQRRITHAMNSLLADTDYHTWAQAHVAPHLELLKGTAFTSEEVRTTYTWVKALIDALEAGHDGSKLTWLVPMPTPGDAVPLAKALPGDPKDWKTPKQKTLLRYLLKHDNPQSVKAICDGAARAGAGTASSIKSNLNPLRAHGYLHVDGDGTTLSAKGKQMCGKIGIK